MLINCSDNYLRLQDNQEACILQPWSQELAGLSGDDESSPRNVPWVTTITFCKRPQPTSSQAA
jgi:hypothetical protein